MNHELARTEVRILLYRDAKIEQQPPRPVQIDVGMKFDQVIAAGGGWIVLGNERADLVGGANRRHVAHAQVIRVVRAGQARSAAVFGYPRAPGRRAARARPHLRRRRLLNWISNVSPERRGLDASAAALARPVSILRSLNEGRVAHARTRR